MAVTLQGSREAEEKATLGKSPVLIDCHGIHKARPGFQRENIALSLVFRDGLFNKSIEEQLIRREVLSRDPITRHLSNWERHQ